MLVIVGIFLMSPFLENGQSLCLLSLEISDHEVYSLQNLSAIFAFFSQLRGTVNVQGLETTPFTTCLPKPKRLVRAIIK